jgi:hypothetical protein
MDDGGIDGRRMDSGRIDDGKRMGVEQMTSFT